ncbi:FRG domain-containing protein [Kribbella sp. NBC_00482]|uniref:FRG domain-containing protein n=1 Tax=Kribbella sp. NBC_00482 TaxID=2975968 RepID=UPI002E19AE38
MGGFRRAVRTWTRLALPERGCVLEPLHRISSVAEYASALRSLGASGLQRPFWFRGHRDDSYRLSASALRSTKLAGNEGVMLKRFMQDARSFLVDAPSNDWEWLFLAQHHNVPTRLLDWSENALVSLYFACETADTPLEGTTPPDGDVWVLLPTALNNAMNSWTGQHPEDLPMFGVDSTLEKYHPLPRTAIPGQEPRNPIAALASRSFTRIANQWGTFTITDQMTALEDNPAADSFLRRLAVDSTAKADILDELRSLGIEERIIYPDLHRLGQRVKEIFQ